MDDSKPKLAENAYARVWGRMMKPLNNRRHVGSHVIRPIKDLNELQCHLLEATMVHLYHTRGPPGSAQSKGAMTNGDDGGTAGLGAQGSNLSPQARKVLQCLQTAEQSNEGLHKQEVALRLQMDMADVEKGGAELLAQSLIFETVDENTWAPFNL